MKLYNFIHLQEDIEYPKQTTVWTYKKQLKLINEIIKYYPTFKDFKHAVIKSGDRKLYNDIKDIDSNIDHNSYINILRSIVVKYSITGKLLSSLLTKIGLGFLASYSASLLYKNTLSNYIDWKPTKSNVSNDQIVDDILNRNISTKELYSKYTTGETLDKFGVERQGFIDDHNTAKLGYGIGGSVAGTILNPLYLYDIGNKKKLNKLYKN
jgi:hypothetical protein